MKTIKFSHIYEKMPKIRTAILLETFIKEKNELSKEFIEYDTLYLEGHYSLPDGKVIILLLKSNDSLWTTIRRYTPEKYEYYSKARGEEFEIKVEK